MHTKITPHLTTWTAFLLLLLFDDYRTCVLNMRGNSRVGNVRNCSYDQCMAFCHMQKSFVEACECSRSRWLFEKPVTALEASDFSRSLCFSGKFESSANFFSQPVTSEGLSEVYFKVARIPTVAKFLGVDRHHHQEESYKSSSLLEKSRFIDLINEVFFFIVVGFPDGLS